MACFRLVLVVLLFVSGAEKLALASVELSNPPEIHTESFGLS